MSGRGIVADGPSAGTASATEVAPDGRRPYSKPILHRLGDLRSMTLGGSGALPESGGLFQPRPGPLPRPG
jgi:hypothetical protein